MKEVRHLASAVARQDINVAMNESRRDDIMGQIVSLRSISRIKAAYTDNRLIIVVTAAVTSQKISQPLLNQSRNNNTWLSTIAGIAVLTKRIIDKTNQPVFKTVKRLQAEWRSHVFAQSYDISMLIWLPASNMSCKTKTSRMNMSASLCPIQLFLKHAGEAALNTRARRSISSRSQRNRQLTSYQ